MRRHQRQPSALSVKGINLIVLFYTDRRDVKVPAHLKVYRHSDGKTKNDYFQAMCSDVWQWGLRPAFVSADSWYSSLENLKFLRNKEVGFLVGLEKNRIVSAAPSQYQQVGEAVIAEEGVYVHLKGFDFIKVFRTVDTDGQARHYGLCLPDAEQCKAAERKLFKDVKAKHWNLEHMFRAIKQLVHAGHFFVRKTDAIKTHLFCLLRAFQKLTLMARDEIIQSLYSLRDQLFLKAQKQFIAQFA